MEQCKHLPTPTLAAKPELKIRVDVGKYVQSIFHLRYRLGYAVVLVAVVMVAVVVYASARFQV